jgi:hypothetical protein
VPKLQRVVAVSRGRALTAIHNRNQHGTPHIQSQPEGKGKGKGLLLFVNARNRGHHFFKDMGVVRADRPRSVIR